MPSWDDPTVKWDDPLYGFDGGTPVTRVPTWSDSLSSWGDPNEGWNGELSTSLQYGAPPGLYVREPRGLQNVLQATIVTRGVPGQPASDTNMYLKLVMPYPATYMKDYVEYDLWPTSPVPLVTTSPTSYGHQWVALEAGTDDGQVWAGTPAWFSTAGGSVYKRSGQTIWRILGSPEQSYGARARLEDGPWVDAFHICGVPTTSPAPLPTGMYRVEPTQYTGYGLQAKLPALGRAFSDNVPVQRMVSPAGSDTMERTLSTSDRTIYRKADYSQPTLTTTGSNVSYFRVRSTPFGHRVYGYVRWENGTNYVLASFGPVADNTAVYTNMCTVIANRDNQWGGYLVSQLGAPWDTVWTMTAGCNFTLDTYTLAGAGTVLDPAVSSAQHHLLYQT